MAYVDLNPIRAAMVATPETSYCTSIKERINNENTKLLSFGDDKIPYYLSEYTALVDYTGKCIHPNKRGYIDDELPDILKRLEIHPDTWIEEMNRFHTDSITAVGTITQLKAFCESVKKKFRFSFQLSALN
jgi:hypothetical protein